MCSDLSLADIIFLFVLIKLRYPPRWHCPIKYLWFLTLVLFDIGSHTVSDSLMLSSSYPVIVIRIYHYCDFHLREAELEKSFLTKLIPTKQW